MNALQLSHLEFDIRKRKSVSIAGARLLLAEAKLACSARDAFNAGYRAGLAGQRLDFETYMKSRKCPKVKAVDAG
ncbi:MAG: hypothetical protein PHV34_24565 [Verrucomicrobiae bacterium]|nr:hypothetical protein [Verrucomicrobiae bacterium]